MIEELLSYSLTDLLMFTPQAYARVFEIYHQSVWPAHLPVLALTFWLIGATRDASALRARLISLLLVSAWATIAGIFFARHYAAINTAAPWFAVGFAVQALLMLFLAVFAGALHFEWRARPVGLAVLLFAVFLVPVAALLAGRSWRGIELFGLTPDATAIGTIGLLMMTRGSARWLLLPLPFLWCVLSFLTYIAMTAKA